MHVAFIDYPAFFDGAFPGKKVKEFVDCVEGIDVSVSKAKLVIHQAARMLWLGDRIAECARGRPALQIFFHLIAAEAVSKITFAFDGEGRSREYVRKFFEELCGTEHHGVLETVFTPEIGEDPIVLRDAVDLLYSIRCDVVHEGQYFSFDMPERDGDTPLMGSIKGRIITVRRPVTHIRQIVLEGAVLAAVRLLPATSDCIELWDG